MRLEITLNRDDIVNSVGDTLVNELLSSWQAVGKSFGSKDFDKNVDKMTSIRAELEGKVRFEIVSEMILTPESAAAMYLETEITGADVESAEIVISGEAIFEMGHEESSVDPRTRLMIVKRYESDPRMLSLINDVCYEVAKLTEDAPYEKDDKERIYRFEKYIASSFLDEYDTFEKFSEYVGRGEKSYGN